MNVDEQMIEQLQEDVEMETVQVSAEEIARFKERLEDEIKLKDRFLRLWDIDNRMWLMRLENPEKITPTHKYEEKPEFWDLYKEKLQAQYEQDKAGAEGRIAQFDAVIEGMKEQIKSQEEVLERFGDEE